MDRGVLNSHARHWPNVKILSPFKGLAVCIFNLTWFQFWLLLTFCWQINLHLNSISTWPEGQKVGVVTTSSMLWSLNAGGFLLFCTWHSWESKCHGLRWIPTQFIQEGFVFISWVTEWMPWISLPERVASESSLQNDKKTEKVASVLHICSVSSFCTFFAFRHYFRIRSMSKVIRGLAQKQISQPPKCLSPVGGSLKWSSDSHWSASRRLLWKGV